MKIIELSFKNVLSYGNIIQSFRFEDRPRLVLVEGENGSGKSTIKEALTVSIYGKSAIRKNKDIPNWINRAAYTRVVFKTNSGDLVELDRGIDPNFSDIKINGAAFNLPDKRKVDEFIEEELTRIPFSVFCNTISLSFDDFKSFTTMSTGDKRKIIDKVFGLDVLSDMRSIVREDIKASKKALDIIEAQVQTNTNLLRSSTEQLNALREKLSKRVDDRADEISKQMEDRRSSQEEIKKAWSELKPKIDEVQSLIDGVRAQQSKSAADLRVIAEKLAVYQKNKCPHCLNDLTSDSSVKIKEAILVKKKLIEDGLPAIQEQLNSLNQTLSTLTGQQGLLKEKNFTIQAELASLAAELKKIQDSIVTDETESIQSIIDRVTSDIEKDSLTRAEKQRSQDLLSSLDDLLSDSGVKKELIDSIIPSLNAKIFELSELFEFKFSFEFDNDFNLKITYLGQEVSPESPSSGQRRKMDLIVILSLLEIIKMKHNTMNVMFLDEIFASLDKSSVYRSIEILRSFVNRHKMTIFVVSQDSLPEEFFDTRIQIKSRNHFSEMHISETARSVELKVDVSEIGLLDEEQ